MFGAVAAVRGSSLAHRRKKPLDHRRVVPTAHSERLNERTNGGHQAQLLRAPEKAERPGNLQSNGERRTPSYVGFVLSTGRPVQRVDLGPAQPIDEAVAQWRTSIVARQRNAAAETLRRRVWEPLAQHIPSQTTTVIIAPDGSLTAIPWAALPGDRPGTVLLEQYAIALVPHAPLLLDRLTAAKTAVSSRPHPRSKSSFPQIAEHQRLDSACARLSH